MRQLVETVFDDFVHGTTPVYSASFHEPTLGSLHQIGIQAVADSVSGSSVELSVELQMCSDGRNWVAKAANPEINRASLSATATNVAVGIDNGSTPSGCLVRLKIFLEGTNPGAHVKLTVCGRGDASSRRTRTALKAGCDCLGATWTLDELDGDAEEDGDFSDGDEAEHAPASESDLVVLAETRDEQEVDPEDERAWRTWRSWMSVARRPMVGRSNAEADGRAPRDEE